MGSKDHGTYSFRYYWYYQAYHDVEIVDNYGSFPNVPLLDTKGGINYNPVLARRQLGYPMRNKLNSIHLSSFFLKEGEDHKEAREKIVKVWHHIHRKSRKDLGPRGAVSLEPYLQWVQARAIQLKMPYSWEAPMPDMFVKTTPPLLDDMEELQLALVRMQQEKEAWKNKCHTLEVSYRADLKEKDDLIKILESRAVETMERQEDLFSSKP